MQVRKSQTEQTVTGNRRRREKEELELVRHSRDLRCEGILMRSACEVGKSGGLGNSLEVFLTDDSLCIWASVKVRAHATMK